MKPNSNTMEDHSPNIMSNRIKPSLLSTILYPSSLTSQQYQSSQCVYNLTQEDSTAPTLSQFQPPIETFNVQTDGLVAGFTATCFAAGLLLVIAAGNFHAEAPGTYYMAAGTILFASKIIEFLAKYIEMVSFILGLFMPSSLLLVESWLSAKMK